MRNRKKIGFLLAAVLLFGAFFRMPVAAEAQSADPNIQVVKIRTNKRVQKVGKNLKIQLKFKSDIRLKKVKLNYAGSGFRTYTVKMKAVNKEKTTWRGVLPLKKDQMKRGPIGIERIYITGRNNRGKKVKCEVRNNQWATEGYGLEYEIGQDLSAGNVKIVF